MSKISDLIFELHQQYPIFPTTFGPCSTKGCENLARGSRECKACVTWKLGNLVGKELASNLSNAIAECRKLESECYDIADELDED